MFYCYICKRGYKNAQSYNDHLRRKYHVINQLKYEMLYGRDKESDKYKKWSKYRDESNEIRQIPTETKSD